MEQLLEKLPESDPLAAPVNKWILYLLECRESERLARRVFGDSLTRFCAAAYEVDLGLKFIGIDFSMRELTIDQFKELGEQMAEVLDASPDRSRAYVSPIWGPTLELVWDLKINHPDSGESVNFKVSLETKNAQGCALNPAKPVREDRWGCAGELHDDCKAVLDSI